VEWLYTVSTNRNIKNVSLLSTFPFVPLFPVSLLPVLPKIETNIAIK